MRALVIGSVFLALLTGCNFAERDDATCQSYGLAFGSTEYATCRQNLNGQRQQAIQAMAQNNQALAQQQQQNLLQLQQTLNANANAAANRNRQTNCITTYIGNQAYTNCN